MKNMTELVILTFKDRNGKTRHLERTVWGGNIAYALAGAVDDAMRIHGIKENTNMKYELKYE